MATTMVVVDFLFDVIRGLAAVVKLGEFLNRRAFWRKFRPAVEFSVECPRGDFGPIVAVALENVGATATFAVNAEIVETGSDFKTSGRKMLSLPWHESGEVEATICSGGVRLFRLVELHQSGTSLEGLTLREAGHGEARNLPTYRWRYELPRLRLAVTVVSNPALAIPFKLDLWFEGQDGQLVLREVGGDGLWQLGTLTKTEERPIIVRLLVAYLNVNANEIAGYPPAEAAALVEAGMAEYHHPSDIAGHRRRLKPPPDQPGSKAPA